MKIDLTQLNILSGSDPSFKYQILRMLRNQAIEVGKEIELRSEMGDWEGVANAAHRFKSAVNVVNVQAYNHFKTLEKEAREAKDPQRLQTLLKQTMKICTGLDTNISLLLPPA